MIAINRKGFKRSHIVWAILAIVLIADLFIFKLVTDKPLGLAPSDLSNSPKIHMSVDASPNIPLEVNKNEPFILVPSLNFHQIEQENQQDFEVIGFGRAGSSLYVQVRLHESLDLSLKKGWGKAIQLIDEQNKKYLYNSYSIPSGVQLYDKLVDLPDDFRANQTILKDGYKDLYLHFPEYPAKSVPTRLWLIESFQGNSPANPGHIYYDIPLTKVAAIQDTVPIMAAEPFDQFIGVTKSLKSHPEISFSVQKFRVDDNLLPKLSITFSGTEDKNVFVKDSVLIDQNGQNYNMFHLEEELSYLINNKEDNQIEIMFERFPSTVKITGLWLKTVIDEKEAESIIPL